MTRLIVVERPERWPFDVPGVQVVSAREYLTAERFAELGRATTLNFCRSYAQNTTGYYVSLLAAARGHRPIPSVTTLQSLSMGPVVRVVSEELDALVERSLSSLKSDEFELSVYFGRNTAQRYDRLSRELFNHFPVPFLRARFAREGGSWSLEGIRVIPASEVPESHREFVIEACDRFFRRGRPGSGPRRESRYDLAILWSEDDPQAPSDARAIRKFLRAADELDMRADIIGPEDLGRLGVYDALFIRETTHVGHRTHRFALRAEAGGLVVIDDPESIVRCTNKVYQAELFHRHGVPAPRTMVVHAGNRAAVKATVGFPCVLKDPAGSFSTGVVKATTDSELEAGLDRFLGSSELVIAQEWTPTEFDWRIGVLDGAVLFSARYHMAPGHWQIIRPDARRGTPKYGRVEAIPADEVPPRVIEVAEAAARPIGSGLYGVDVKELPDGRVVVTEVNDNPNIESGCEDGVLGDALYTRIMEHFLRQLEARGRRS